MPLTGYFTLKLSRNVQETTKSFCRNVTADTFFQWYVIVQVNVCKKQKQKHTQPYQLISNILRILANVLAKLLTNILQAMLIECLFWSLLMFSKR